MLYYMKLLRFIKGKLRSREAVRQREALLNATSISTISPEEFPASLKDPTLYYKRAFQDFHREIPLAVREHRNYFIAERRGFGEDAFHTMWWHLITRFRPASFLEIGVYRGQTLSLVSLLAKIEGFETVVTGISPFSSAGDSVSNYDRNLDYQADTLANFAYFELPPPELVKAYSTDAQAVELIRGRIWDIIYIDGNHDYEIVKADWAICCEVTAVGGLIVLDDSGLSTSYQPPAFATGGHPGPSKLASEINDSRYEEILQVGHNRVFRRLT